MKSINNLLVLSLVSIVAGCGSKSPVATVSLSQIMQPKAPLSSQYMQIAVLNANMEGSSSGEFDQQKWSTMTADMIQYYLEQASEKHGIPLKLVDREHLKLAQGEKDLAAAGATDSGDAMSAAQFKGAAAIITSKVTVKIDKQVGKKRSVNAMSLVAGAFGGGGSASTEQVDEEARNITVSSQFQLKDPATNDIIVSHNALPSQEYNRTKASPFFGSSRTEADMNPRDQVIGGKIERNIQEFLAKVVPMEVKADVTVKPSRNEESVAGVRSLVQDDYNGALNHFKQAIAVDGNDHKSLFGAGVCCEKLKNYEEARKYYKTAQSLDTKDEQYNAAVSRVERLG